jgi:hypothetical protein
VIHPSARVFIERVADAGHRHNILIVTTLNNQAGHNGRCVLFESYSTTNGTRWHLRSRNAHPFGTRSWLWPKSPGPPPGWARRRGQGSRTGAPQGRHRRHRRLSRRTRPALPSKGSGAVVAPVKEIAPPGARHRGRRGRRRADVTWAGRRVARRAAEQVGAHRTTRRRAVGESARDSRAAAERPGGKEGHRARGIRRRTVGRDRSI